jgi:hypothetical protein
MLAQYAGPFDESTWGTDGRFYTDVLPFFQKHMAFVGNEHNQRYR